MTRMRSFRFPEDSLRQLQEIAKRKHDDNQTQALLEAIDRYYQELNPPKLQGYIRLDRVQDGHASGKCPGCSRPETERTWIAVYSNGSMKGVLCDECVEAGRA